MIHLKDIIDEDMDIDQQEAHRSVQHRVRFGSSSPHSPLAGKERRPPPYVLMTGHNVGAALAVLNSLALACTHRASKILTYTLGCPPVLSAATAQLYRQFLRCPAPTQVMALNLCHYRDEIPLFDPFNVGLTQHVSPIIIGYPWKNSEDSLSGDASVPDTASSLRSSSDAPRMKVGMLFFSRKPTLHDPGDYVTNTLLYHDNHLIARHFVITYIASIIVAGFYKNPTGNALESLEAQRQLEYLPSTWRAAAEAMVCEGVAGVRPGTARPHQRQQTLQQPQQAQQDVLV